MRRTHNALKRSGRSLHTSSTGCFFPPPRTMATASPGRPCSSCSTPTIRSKRRARSEQLQRIMVRRLKSELPPACPTARKGFPEARRGSDRGRIPGRGARSAPAARGVRGPAAQLPQTNRTHGGAEFSLKLLKKRLFSSPAAFARTLEVHRETARGGRLATSVRRPCGFWRPRSTVQRTTSQTRKNRLKQSGPLLPPQLSTLQRSGRRRPYSWTA